MTEKEEGCSYEERWSCGSMTARHKKLYTASVSSWNRRFRLSQIHQTKINSDKTGFKNENIFIKPTMGKFQCTSSIR